MTQAAPKPVVGRTAAELRGGRRLPGRLWAYGSAASPPMGIDVKDSFLWSFLALLFFTTGLGFWTYSWWTRDKSQSNLALQYCLVFCLAGIVTLLLWRVTSR